MKKERGKVQELEKNQGNIIKKKIEDLKKKRKEAKKN